MGASAAGPRAQRYGLSRLSGAPEHRIPQMAAGHPVGAGLHTGFLAAGGLPAGLLTAPIESEAHLTGAGRADVSIVDHVAQVGRATEVSKAAVVENVNGRCEFS